MTDRRTNGQTELRRLRRAEAVAAFARKNSVVLCCKTVRDCKLCVSFNNVRTLHDTEATASTRGQYLALSKD